VTDFKELVDLAAERLGGAVLWANDEFFAPKERLLRPEAPVFLEHEYTDRGKWMDGWETRRRRTPGHDACLVRLGLPGLVRGVVVDTRFFRGNYPAECRIEGCLLRGDAGVDELLGETTAWFDVLERRPLVGDAVNEFDVQCPVAVSHLRFSIYPDGGVARLRVHGEALPDWRALGGAAREQDLASLAMGARVLTCSDMFFGPMHNLILPGRSTHMGDGWETRRRRGPGHDWIEVELAAPGEVARVVIETTHFKGNAPDACAIEARDATSKTPDQWRELLPRTKLHPHTDHVFVEELCSVGCCTHLKLRVYPDGGVARMRVYGALTAEARRDAGLRRLNAWPEAWARRELGAVCGADAWVAALLAARPFAGADALRALAAKAFDAMSERDWLDAFAHHPPIGQSQAARALAAKAQAWSSEEQSGVRSAAAETLAALEAGNRAYQERFGFVFLICATGKSAEEILAAMRARAGASRESELGTAARELRAIAALRLERLLLP
jgi:allantoicase